jgi:hypothetical protein
MDWKNEMNEDLKSRLKTKVVENCGKIAKAKLDKKASNKGFAELIKKLVHIESVILEALNRNDENILIDRLGEFYQSELGIRKETCQPLP